MPNHKERKPDTVGHVSSSWSSREQIDPSDRQEVATKLLELAPLIRRRLQYKLSGHDRRLFDTQDLLSTILRRVDAMIAKGTLRATTDRELISLVLTMLDNTLIDRHRLMQRIKRLEADDRVWASWVRIHERPDDEKIAIDTVTELFDSIESADDRLMLSLRLGGASHSMIAEILEISPAACRQRWVSLKREISAMQPKQMDSGI